jgi:hypothetical protein
MAPESGCKKMTNQEDVCKWVPIGQGFYEAECDGEYYRTDLLLDDKCPYCGKPIKVVPN